MKLYLPSLKGFTISEHQCKPEKSLDRVWFYVYAGGSGSMGHEFDEDPRCCFAASGENLAGLVNYLL